MLDDLILDGWRKTRSTEHLCTLAADTARGARICRERKQMASPECLDKCVGRKQESILRSDSQGTFIGQELQERKSCERGLCMSGIHGKRSRKRSVTIRDSRNERANEMQER